MSNDASIDRSWKRTVACPLCNFGATVKVTKTDNLVLRCDSCHALIFANGTLSQIMYLHIIILSTDIGRFVCGLCVIGILVLTKPMVFMMIFSAQNIDQELAL